MLRDEVHFGNAIAIHQDNVVAPRGSYASVANAGSGKTHIGMPNMG